jgi:hypothetical protein
MALGDRSRLDVALPRSTEGGIARRDRSDESLASYEAAANLPALGSTGLMHRFLPTLGTSHR